MRSFIAAYRAANFPTQVLAGFAIVWLTAFAVHVAAIFGQMAVAGIVS